jgi:hypothetical protein
LLGKHNATPASEVKKRQSKKLAAPDLVHDAGAYRSAFIFATEAEALLNAGMQLVELLAQGELVD